MAKKIISIHAPRTGSDGLISLREVLRMSISIHAPRAGSDGGSRGVRPLCNLFQSTLPVRGATYYSYKGALYLAFQSTLPVRGATFCPVPVTIVAVFQSTLPVRGATAALLFSHCKMFISIHAPRAGSDC